MRRTGRQRRDYAPRLWIRFLVELYGDYGVILFSGSELRAESQAEAESQARTRLLMRRLIDHYGIAWKYWRVSLPPFYDQPAQIVAHGDHTGTLWTIQSRTPLGPGHGPT